MTLVIFKYVDSSLYSVFLCSWCEYNWGGWTVTVEELAAVGVDDVQRTLHKA